MFSLLPLVIIAVMLRVFPDEFIVYFDPSQPAAENSIALEKSRLFYLALFCIVPFSLVVLARLLKNKGREIFGFSGMILGALILSIGYLGVILYVLIATLLSGGMVNSTGYGSLVCSCVLLSLAMLSNLLSNLPRAPVLGVRVDNQGAFWLRVHPPAVSTLTYALLLCGVTVAYYKTIPAVIFMSCTVLAGYLFLTVYVLIRARKSRISL